MKWDGGGPAGLLRALGHTACPQDAGRAVWVASQPGGSRRQVPAEEEWGGGAGGDGDGEPLRPHLGSGAVDLGGTFEAASCSPRPPVGIPQPSFPPYTAAGAGSSLPSTATPVLRGWTLTRQPSWPTLLSPRLRHPPTPKAP